MLPPSAWLCYATATTCFVAFSNHKPRPLLLKTLWQPSDRNQARTSYIRPVIDVFKKDMALVSPPRVCTNAIKRDATESDADVAALDAVAEVPEVDVGSVVVSVLPSE